MEDQALSCTVKPAVYLNIGAEAAARSGVCVLDVNLPVGTAADVSCASGRDHWSRARLSQNACVLQIERIVFKNYYTAYVTVRLLRSRPGQEAPARWCTALRDLALMENPHTEEGSQDYCCISRAQVGALRARRTAQVVLGRARDAGLCADAGGAGSRVVGEADPPTAVLRVAELHPGGHQDLPSEQLCESRLTSRPREGGACTDPAQTCFRLY